MIEAIALGEELGVSLDRIYLQAGQAPLSTTGRCSLLTEEGLCSVYRARPLLCRTHGLALKSADRPDVSHCELNFTQNPPHLSSVLDVDNLHTALFAVNLEYCHKLGIDPLSRIALDRLAALRVRVEP
ncbi:MAG: YkgJ family cysteine cluster protein [Myxococcota bacterium]|jgi:Fe-S-cluster containining protein|nr:YkgJ family cysteine cluster protein [Myxococcota bacterium]